MRAKTTSLLIALAMLLPTAALASGWGCEKRMIADPCLEQPDPGDRAPVLAAACCCNIQGSDDGSIVDQPPAVERTADDELSPVTASVTLWLQAPTIHQHARIPSRARAPPPQTLLAQRVALIC